MRTELFSADRFCVMWKLLNYWIHNSEPFTCFSSILLSLTNFIYISKLIIEDFWFKILYLQNQITVRLLIQFQKFFYTVIILTVHFFTVLQYLDRLLSYSFCSLFLFPHSQIKKLLSYKLQTRSMILKPSTSLYSRKE